MADKKTIGLTPEAKIVMEKLMAKGYFHDQMDAAKFAMSFAINCGVDTSVTINASTTWNIGSFDPDREIKNTISVLYPEAEEPYRLIENLYNQGLILIGKHIEENGDIFMEDLIVGHKTG